MGKSTVAVRLPGDPCQYLHGHHALLRRPGCAGPVAIVSAVVYPEKRYESRGRSTNVVRPNEGSAW